MVIDIAVGAEPHGDWIHLSVPQEPRIFTARLVHSCVGIGSVTGSRQPNQPKSWQVADVVDEIGVVMVGAGVTMLLEVVESWQPNQPGVLHEDVVEVVEVEVDVAEAPVVVAVGSLQPNQPGVLQVDVVVVVVLVVVVVVVVVDSSRQPHHPGVLHVEVLVRVGEALVVVVVVVISEPLLLKNFQSTQS